MTFLICAFVIAGAGLTLRSQRLCPHGRTRRGCDRSLASFVLISAAAVIIWQHAGTERLARDGSRAAGAGSAAGARGRVSSGTLRREAAEEGCAGGIRSLALRGARSKLLERLDDGMLTKGARGLVGALVLADRRGVDWALSETYSYVGITHFLALSGMHLGAIAIPLSYMLMRCFRSRRRSDIALLAVLCAYSSVAGFPASLLRALFLSAAFIGYRLIGMPGSLLDSLLAGSFVCVALDPSLAFDVGFQLSFSAVCAIALIAVPLSRAMETRLPRGIPGTITKAIAFPALITCAVQFFTMPLVIHFFKRVSCFSPVVNVVISLPFTALLYSGLLYVFVPWKPMHCILAPMINPLCRFLEWAPGIFARKPHAAVYPGDFHAGAYLSGAALIAWALQKCCPHKRRMLFGGALCVVLAFFVPGERKSGGSASNAAMDSGRKDAIRHVSCGGGAYLGVGRGIIFLETDFTSGDAYRMTRALWAEGVRNAGLCVVSPSHIRRNHGILYLLKRIRVEEVLCTPYLLLEDADLPDRLRERGARIRGVCGVEIIRDGRWRLEIAGPPFPPPRGAPLSGSDAALAWRLIAGRMTSLDLQPGGGYHPNP